MPSPFDYINSFNKTKKSLINDISEFEKDYNPFIVNRALSNNPATLVFAEVMNSAPFLDKKIQHDWYMYAIPKNNIYSKYIKKQSSINIDESLIQFVQYDMSVSESRAIEMIELLGEQKIRDLMEKRGGIDKCNKKKK